MSSIIKVDQIQLSDGSTPTAGDLGLNTSGAVVGFGRVKWSNESYPINTTSFVDVLNGTITYTPKLSDSTLYITANCSVRTNGNSVGLTFRIVVDDVVVTYQLLNHEFYLNDGATDDRYDRMSKEAIVTNTSTSPKVIKVQMADYTGNNNTSRINFGDRFESYLTVFEIAN